MTDTTRSAHTANELLGVHLALGKHDSPSDGLCLLEAVAWFAGLPHTDRPSCTSPTLGAMGRALNDELPDDLRQQLLPLVPMMVGTAGDGLDEARGYLAMDWLIRTYTPAWLDLSTLTAEAASLRDAAPICDLATGDAAKPAISAAYSAARSAAYSAARSAARSAAYSAARSAAYSAARSAARSAAYSAARSAAYSAAYSAADSVLNPVVRTLQESAIDLLARMIRPAAQASA